MQAKTSFGSARQLWPQRNMEAPKRLLWGWTWQLPCPLQRPRLPLRWWVHQVSTGAARWSGRAATAAVTASAPLLGVYQEDQLLKAAAIGATLTDLMTTIAPHRIRAEVQCLIAAFEVVSPDHPMSHKPASPISSRELGSQHPAMSTMPRRLPRPGQGATSSTPNMSTSGASPGGITRW